MHRLRVGFVLAAGCFLLVGTRAVAQGPAVDSANDKYTWLEDATGDRSMAWVKAENAKTAAVLEKDPHYSSYFDQALAIGEDPRKLAFPGQRGSGEIYNTWRDKNNPRGLVRKTTTADYLTDTPHWTTVLDVDALGKAEGVGWVLKGFSCLYPGDEFCMVELSAGGEDAVTMREFDLKTAKFVPGGFALPHSKENVAWLDQDTLLVERDWGAGSMTASGYPFVSKVWKRGTPLESAKEIFRGQPTDVSAGGSVQHDAQGDKAVVFQRATDFFNTEYSVQTPRGIERLMIPGKANPVGLLSGRMLVEVREPWTPGAGQATIPQGSLVQLQLADVMKDPAHLKPVVVFAPTADEFLQGVRTTHERLLITTLAHVQGRAYVYAAAGNNSWSKQRLTLPENVSVGVISTSDTDERFFLSLTGFLTPTSIWMGDATKATAAVIKSQPAQFDGSKDVVEQYEATSKDGTRVPYFIVHPKGMKLDGSHATLLTAYGGFDVSETPTYSGVMGKLWLEHGGVYVLANIRGGGEFGPAWHEAGLKTKRQVIYDDFSAVGKDLITRGVTSARRLGIEGGSNGGLLMGVEMTQHPEEWNAIVIQVPLLDMLRFEKIAAGASWVGEYGSVDNPQEKAFLAGISPYNQLKEGVKYPEPLIFTTTKDDRVGPQHARKFAARMEEFHEPFYYAEITEGGHGSGADLKQTAGTNAVTYVYLERKLME